jgi:hypothetical protein
LSHEETRDLLDDLVARALLELTRDGSVRRVIIHDLLRGFIAAACGPEQITEATSLYIADLRQQAEEALTSDEVGQHPELAQDLLQWAQYAEEQLGQPWRALAGELRGLADQLKSGSAAPNQ